MISEYQYTNTGLNLPPYTVEYVVSATETRYYGGLIPATETSLDLTKLQNYVSQGLLYLVATKFTTVPFTFVVQQ